MTVDSVPMTASCESEKALAPVWQIRVGTRLSRAAAIAGLAVVVALALLPMIASRNLIQDLIFVFTMLALAQLWNVLAGWGGLVSVGQQAFVGLGAYFTIKLADWGLNPFVAMLAAGAIVAAIAVPLSFPMLRLRGGEFAIGMWVVAELFRLLVTNDQSVGGGTGRSLKPPPSFIGRS